jgi:ArsR family transcriptional regulator
MRDRLNSDECSKYFKALADPERLRIVQCLQEGPRTVGEVTRKLGLPIANVSHHFKQLKIGGLVTSRKEGRNVYYALGEELAKKTASGKPGVLDVLDFGCCRLELGKTKGDGAEA